MTEEWPSYFTGPRDHIHALGVISLSYNGFHLRSDARDPRSATMMAEPAAHRERAHPLTHRKRTPIAMIGQRPIATISIRHPIKRHMRSRHG